MISNGRAAASSRGTGTHRPVLLAIAGDSAAGKTTLARGIETVLGPERVTRICTDDYHRYDREDRARLRITPLDPQCNYLDVIEQHLRLLAEGEAILKPRYDHTTGTFLPPEYVRPREFVLIEGLLPLHTRAMRDSLDVKVYLDPDEDLRRQWKIERDCAKRGYTPDQVVAELDLRAHDTATYIRPQRAHGDIVVRFHHPDRPSPDGHLAARVVLRPTLPHPDLEPVLGSDAGAPPIRLLLDRDHGKPADVLEIEADCPPEAALEVERSIWARLKPDQRLQRHRIGRYVRGEGEQRSESLALAQLLIVYHLVTALSSPDGPSILVPEAELAGYRTSP
jgi:phosphoribulokinase